MITADVFHAAGLLTEAENLRSHGLVWLRQRQHVVRRVAAAAGLQIEDAIAADIDSLEPKRPTDCPTIDVMIPFHSADAQWVGDAVRSSLASKYVLPIVHVVADGCEFPDDLPANALRYKTPGGWGPYRIQNGLVSGGNCLSKFLAILDADDTMTPDRLWRHVAMLRQFDADMISSAVENVPADDSETTRKHVAWQQIVKPAVRYETCPHGRCVNTSRTMRRQFFESVNGFANMTCSADFDLDNRCRPWARIIDDQRICGTRRVHHRSLSHGIAPIGSAPRQKDLDTVVQHLRTMQASPTIKTAASLGSLNQSQKLPVCETGDRSE